MFAAFVLCMLLVLLAAFCVMVSAVACCIYAIRWRLAMRWLRKQSCIAGHPLDMPANN